MLLLQILLFTIIGGFIGAFGTLCFFRMDKMWKQIVLGLGSAATAGGVGTAYISFFNVKDKHSVVIYIALAIGIIISVYFMFKKLCILLKNQSGKNVIRVLDIVLGYDKFIKDYYETRKKTIDKSLNLEELEKKKIKIDNKEQLLETKEQQLNDQVKAINEQKKGSLKIKLPEDYDFILTSSFIEKIPLYVENLSRFIRDVEQLTDDISPRFDADEANNINCLKAYFAGVGMYVANDLFGTMSTNVRTHFRILKGQSYTQYTVVLGDQISNDKISDIPVGKSMISKSFELKKSLVASLNPGNIFDTKTKWEDFMTITYCNLIKDGIPFLSMGISIKYGVQYREMLYFLNFYGIEEFLQSCLDKINMQCDIIKTLKEGE